jgi:hypothetical protein
MSLTFTTIGALASGLPRKYGNRQDLNNIADGSNSIVALTQVIEAITETYEFEELKFQTPIPPDTPLSLATSNPVVPISTLLQTITTQSATYPNLAALYPQFIGQNIVDLTDVFTFWMWYSGGTNQAGRTLKYRRVTTVDQDSYGITSSTQGAVGLAPPIFYTRFGQSLQVGPSPDNPYQFFVRLKIRHPVPYTSPFVPATLTPVVSAFGNITGITIVNGGSGYPTSTTVPLVFNTPVGGGTAVGTATCAGGVVTGANMSNTGFGYIAASATANTGVASSQSVFVPSSWHETIQYGACWRIATWLGEVNYMQIFDAQLKAKGVDIAQAFAVKSQMKRDETHNERQVTLQLGGKYTFA